MKKVSLLAAVSLIAAQGAFATSDGAAPASTAPCPSPFKGFFLGGNIGYGIGGAKQSLGSVIAAVPDTTTSTSNRLALRGVDGGINVGYNYVFGNKWGLGLEFVANWASSNGKLSLVANDAGVPFKYTAQNGAKLNNSLQLRGNFSYVIANLVAPKIILGWDNSQWKQTLSSTQTGVTKGYKFNKKHRYNGFLWGFGVDFLAMKHVILGFEYTGTIAKKKKFASIDKATGNKYSSSLVPQYNKFALTAKVIY